MHELVKKGELDEADKQSLIDDLYEVAELDYLAKREKIKDPYACGNEHVTVFANELGILLVDKLAIRAKQEVEPLELTHDEFITFMKDFKKFIEENS